MAFDPNTFAQNPMLAAIMARTMGGASGMPVPQEAMPGGGAIEGTIQQTAEQEVDLPKLIGERLDLKMAPPASRGGVLAGGLAIALQNAWNARTKNREVELENAIKKNEAIREHKQKLEDLKLDMANKKEIFKYEQELKEGLPSQQLDNQIKQAALQGAQLRNANIGQPRGGGGGQSVGAEAPALLGGINKKEIINIPVPVEETNEYGQIQKVYRNIPHVQRNGKLIPITELMGQSAQEGTVGNSFDAQTAAHLSKSQQTTATPVAEAPAAPPKVLTPEEIKNSKKQAAVKAYAERNPKGFTPKFATPLEEFFYNVISKE